MKNFAGVVMTTVILIGSNCFATYSIVGADRTHKLQSVADPNAKDAVGL